MPVKLNKTQIYFLLLSIFLLASSLLSTINFDLVAYVLPTGYIFLIGSISIIGFSILLIKEFSPFRNVAIRSLDLVVILTQIYLSVRYVQSSQYNKHSEMFLFYTLCFILYYILRLITASKNWIDPIALLLKAILLIGSGQVMYAFLQWFGILPNIFGFSFGGSFGNPGNLSNLLVISFMISIGLALSTNINRTFYILLSILHLVIIIASSSRTSWMACLISLAFILYNKYGQNIRSLIIQYFNPKKWHLMVLFFSILTMFLFLTFLVYKMKQDSANGRFLIWHNCIELIKAKPIFGHGYLSLNAAYANEQINYFRHHGSNSPYAMLAGTPVFAFNDYLQYSVEYGLVFLIPFGFILRTILKKNIQVLKDRNDQVVRAALLAIFISMISSYPLQNHTILMVFFLLLAALAPNSNIILELKVKRKMSWIYTVVVILFNIFLIREGYLAIKYGKEWKNAFELSATNPTEAVNQYESLSKHLNKNRSFIYNKGLIYFKAGQYRHCIDHFEHYKYVFNSKDVFITLGEAYEKLDNFDKAEENYLKASLLIPYLFVPKYKLFDLYRHYEMDALAMEMANDIMKMKIKVYSADVGMIKTAVSNYLFTKSMKDEEL